MQSLGIGLRRVTTSLRTVQSHHVANSSRVLLWEARRCMAGANWIVSNLKPQLRKDNTPKELAAAKKAVAKQGLLSPFESLPEIAEGAVSPKKKKKYTEHKYSTANFKISHRKLNQLGRQIAGKPIDAAILQMQFSEKRASKRIKSMLAVAKDHATKLKGLDEKKLIVAEAWVSKGPKVLKRLETKARGRFGIREHPDSRMHVVLKEGKTRLQLAEEERARKLRRIVSAGVTREDVPLRNPSSSWQW
ncbi:mitochondrial 50S ribosomal protein L22 [Laetiporus sulphureus 93-53]|uniref:Mitochondrial 50S ribosomal protein L22 n=1 Tax=Laetiporus sulphureus 93-53 TaxID=1314785 RepID=A0A165I408_9APHY|nr:mitochondrial 50S ribosomal protein L22 [Laetiporus sulphureus 93-53]KZT12567.1 mitochondrial 50S ribosomal protein L22 [Laetiporus sulphureus 93-53]